ncbi:MAG: FecR domain-containing protein [Gemmataceae bacterium]|nr:FecR domain-containing protein [Gemmata sp.]MDW8199070.1 FecR domain-containing protein [Gemmataceae bacterium]
MNRIAELTTQLLDGHLTEAAAQELDCLLANDPGAEAQFLMMLELEAELRALRRGWDLTEPTLRAIEKERAERMAHAVLQQIITATPPAWVLAHTPHAAPPIPSARRFRWIVAGLLTCAAALFVAISVADRFPRTVPLSSGSELASAKLIHKSGSVELVSPSGETIAAEEGHELPPGFTLRTGSDDSLAVIELLQDQTRLEIESDTLVRFTAEAHGVARRARFYLASGQLSATIPSPRQGEPLVISTSVAEVLARNGNFIVSSASPESARVDIKHGDVQLLRPASTKPTALASGKSAVVFAGIETVDIERILAVDRQPLWTGPPAANFRDVTFSPTGEEVWVANARLLVRWNKQGKLSESSFYPRRSPDDLALFSRDKRFLLTLRGERDDCVLVRTLPDGGEHLAINARPTDAKSWVAAPDAAWIAVVDPRPQHRRVTIWDSVSGEQRLVRTFDDLFVTAMAAAPDGRALAVGLTSNVRSVGNKVALLDSQTGEQRYALSVLKRPITTLAFSADGHYLAVGFSGTIQVWDLRLRELLRSISGFERPITCLTFSPDGSRLAAGTPDGYVWLWETSTGRHIQRLELGGRGVRAIAFSPDGQQLVTLANHVPVAVWKLVDPRPATPAIQ